MLSGGFVYLKGKKAPLNHVVFNLKKQKQKQQQKNLSSTSGIKDVLF